MRFQETEAIDWDEIEVEGPDVEDRQTLLLLAKMTNNAYLSPGEQGWYELGDNWNVVRVYLPVHVILLAYSTRAIEMILILIAIELPIWLGT